MKTLTNNKLAVEAKRLLEKGQLFQIETGEANLGQMVNGKFVDNIVKFEALFYSETKHGAVSVDNHVVWADAANIQDLLNLVFGEPFDDLVDDFGMAA